MEPCPSDRLCAVRASARTVVFAVTCAIVFGAVSPLRAAPKEDWLPVSPEELTATASLLEPDAPAEVLFRKVEVDDRDYPEERVTRQYIRFKVFRPEQIDEVTRLAIFSNGAESKVKLSGRLTLRDGTAKVFGEESIRERTVAQSAAEKNLVTRLFGMSSREVKERFLAISGVEPGAILEYRIKQTESRNFQQGFPLQTPDLPVRLLEYRIRAGDPDNWVYNYFVLHKRIGQVTLDPDRKKNIVTIAATNLPSMPREPLMARAPAFYGLYFLFSYDPIHVRYLARKRGIDGDTLTVDPRITGPWSPFANRCYVLLDDRVEVTSRIRQLTAQVIAGADTPLEKARRIHRRVQTLYADFRRESKQNSTGARLDTVSRTLDDLLDYSRKSNVAGLGSFDYCALAMALYRAAGLECKAIRLPDRRMLPFNRQLVASATLPVEAVAVRIDDQWIYSLPGAWPAQAFGTLPWYCEGESGLWLQAGKEEFAPIPCAAVEFSMIGNVGKFELSADGMLAGEVRCIYRGHAAETLRAVLENRDEARQRNYFTQRLKDEFKLPGSETSTAEDAADTTPTEAAADATTTADGEDTATTPDAARTAAEAAAASAPAVVVTKISGVRDPDVPIEVTYRLRLPGFAVVTAGRMIFRPFPFRLNSRTPFTASTRKLDVWFPYAWEELDSAVIKLPPDYTPEFSEPLAMQPGSVLHYRPQITFNAEKHELQTRREFANQNIVVPVAAYGGLRASYDEMVRGDQQEVVLNRAPATAGGAPAAP